MHLLRHRVPRPRVVRNPLSLRLLNRPSTSSRNGGAGALLGRIHLVGGVAATVGTAWILAKPRLSGSRAICVLLSATAAAGSLLSLLLLSTHSAGLTTTLLWLFVPAIYLYIGPTLGLLNNLVPPHMRALALATSLFLANVANLVVAPQLVGALSDWYARDPAYAAEAGHPLRAALLWLAPVGAWAALHFGLCARALVRSSIDARAPGT